MDVKLNEDIYKIFINNKGYARTKDIKDKGINKYALTKLLNEGIISRIKVGLYRWNDYEDYNEYKDLAKIIPCGVLCLISALDYYKLTTYNSNEYNVAIERSKKVNIPDYPPIKLYYFSEKYYSEGITEVDIDGVKLKIYDMEKAICDCFRYRKQIGKDILLECLSEYSKRHDKNISKLMKYAKLLKVEKHIKQYMEAFLYE